MFKWLRRNASRCTDADLEYVLSRAKYNVSSHAEVPFSNEERRFFQELVNQCRQANLNPRNIRLTRMANMGFNVDTHNAYVGKIRLYNMPDRYAVQKIGAKRAYRVFERQDEAASFLSAHPGYRMEIRSGNTNHYMQCLIGMSRIHELNDATLEECIAAIPYWIRYMKYCNRI